MTTQMKVTKLILDPVNNMPMVVLQAADDRYGLNIWVGLLEASAIAVELERIALPRPMTHDLLCSAILSLGGCLEGIEVSELRDNTFIANLLLRQDGRVVRLDARPSDAIVVALRLGAPIFVHESVLEETWSNRRGGDGPMGRQDQGLDCRLETLARLPRRAFGRYRV